MKLTSRFLYERQIRFGAGAAQYGDRSFFRLPVSIVDEIKEEAIDVSGWSLILSHNRQWRDRPIPLTARVLVRLLHVQGFLVWLTCQWLRRVLG